MAPSSVRDRLARAVENLYENIFLEPSIHEIESVLVRLASNDEVTGLSGEIPKARDSYFEHHNHPDVQERECALLELYLAIHRAGSGYSAGEKALLNTRLGNYCIPGGLLPLVLAQPFIEGNTVVADLGAGNGLQGLLMQSLWPHARTVQIELSLKMIEVGRVMQRALEIPESRVEWVHGDILDTDLSDVGFVYLYRPARPYGEGNALYKSIARKFEDVREPMVVMSVSDCMERFLGEGFSKLFKNEHVSIFLKE